MQKLSASTNLRGIIGQCGARQVFMGFAPARLLHAVSFADTLNDETGTGYQRPRDRKHSLDFKRYIAGSGASTIPLTFNLRKDLQDEWQIIANKTGAELRIARGARCMAQVDCQHRLGELHDSAVQLAFMAFVGLDLRGEMAMFTIINSKAKGLASSLTDFHTSNLVEDIVRDAPHLYLARELNEDAGSPWFRRVRYGGETSSGMRRTTSLRMMQSAIRRLLAQINSMPGYTVRGTYALLLAYWRAVGQVFPTEWESPRSYLLTKGVGLHAMTELLGSIVTHMNRIDLRAEDCVKALLPLKRDIDWGPSGTFSNAGGRKGAKQAHETLRRVSGV